MKIQKMQWPHGDIIVICLFILLGRVLKEAYIPSK